ncbi:MAG: response regulator [Deltaproteobacteria bacterium]|nr:response regulator [Kofleriaceae bacterium]
MTTDDVLLSGVIDQLPLGVWIARAPGGELLFANQVFREILGIEARGDVAVGGYSEPYGIMGLDGKPYPEARMPFVRALEARATVTVEDIVIHRHDGRRVNIRATARPIFDGDVITHIVIAFADYTAEREACARQREAEERARQDERLQAIGTLAAGVAHDFNNVLAQIRILASMLRVREQDASRVEDLVRIEQATDSAAALTRSLLAFGRHPAGNVVRFDLDAVVAGVVDLVRRTFERHITIEHRREPGAFVAGDQNQLEQVILNLAVNARDAMAHGGTLTFAVRTIEGAAPPPLRPGRWVVVEASDTGAGVPPELRPRVFEPYFSTKQGREARGTGLGLATAYGVVQAHGGVIEVGDAEPSGARFTVYLPAASAASDRRAARGELVRGRGKVLLVDDELPLRRALRRALEHMGYETIEAGDGAAAVEAFRAHRGELAAVVLDHVMPVMTGGDAYKIMRELDPSVPVIMTSGRLEEALEHELRDLGIERVMHKPFDLEELSRALRQAITHGP